MKKLKFEVRQMGKSLTLFSGIAAILLGVAVIFGWHLHLLFIIQVKPFYNAIPYNPALGFALAGIGLLAALYRQKYLAIFCGTLITLLGFLTILEYGLDLNFHIDELFLNTISSTTHLIRDECHPMLL